MVRITINQLVDAEVEPNKLTINIDSDSKGILAQLLRGEYLKREPFLHLLGNFVSSIGQSFFDTFRLDEKKSSEKKYVFVLGHLITGTIPEVMIIDMLRSMGYGVTIITDVRGPADLRSWAIPD